MTIQPDARGTWQQVQVNRKANMVLLSRVFQWDHDETISLCKTSRERLRSRPEHSQSQHDVSHNDVLLYLCCSMESEAFLSLSRSAECRNVTQWDNGREIAQPTESGGDCFSLFFCLPLVCAVSVFHILCLVAQVVQSVEKHTLGTRFCHIMFLFGLWCLITWTDTDKFTNKACGMDVLQTKSSIIPLSLIALNWTAKHVSVKGTDCGKNMPKWISQVRQIPRCWRWSWRTDAKMTKNSSQRLWAVVRRG